MADSLKTTVRREVTVERTPLFYQLCGKYELPVDPVTVREWDVDVTLPDAWNVGVITGPSMAGKNSIAEALFGAGCVVEQGRWPWPDGKCIGDGFPPIGVDAIAGLLSAVGFSSPPDWKKQYAALSNGGKFRVDLARTLAEAAAAAPPGEPWRAVVDEFGSLTHQQARCVAAEAVAKHARRTGGQFVALCVHPDAIPSFAPDWIIDIVPGQPVRLAAVRGSVRRPDIELVVRRVDRTAWERVFHAHHYLDSSLNRTAKCFCGFVDGRPAVFTAVIYFPHATADGWREHRTVCLPDFQGIGIGNRMSELIASAFRTLGKPYRSTTSHPAMIKHRARSPLWAMTRKPSLATPHKGGGGTGMAATGSTARITATFQYVGPANDAAARALGVLKAPAAA